MKKPVLILAMAAVLAACAEKPAAAPATAQKSAPKADAPAKLENVLPQLPPGHPAIEQTVAAAGQKTASESQATISGRVVETMNAGGYTYLRIATPAGDAWAAVRQTTLKKGTTVTVATQMVAENFESKTLHRKFDRIILGALTEGPTDAPTAEANAMGTPAQHMSSATDVGEVKVDKAAGGKAIADVWAGKKELKDKPVVIRGKVVKFLPGIMGKNWLHLRDGSGKRAEGTDDITVTTQDVVKVGDIVTVSGTLRLDKDFGAGYVYAVIVEDARVEK